MTGKHPELKKTLAATSLRTSLRNAAPNVSQNVPQSTTDSPVSDYRLWAEEWILDGELRQLSLHTLAERRDILEKLFWFLDREGYETLGFKELRAFFHHLNNGHTEPDGRFDNPRLTRPLRPVSLRGWHVVLSAWFGWMVKEEYLATNLMKQVPAPIVREDIKQPLSGEQVRRLLAVARRSPHARRDVGLLLFLADTGVRCSELIQLKVTDVDLQSRTFIVKGKGRNNRHGYLGSATTQALKAYSRSKRGKKCEYVFESEKGSCGNIGEGAVDALGCTTAPSPAGPGSGHSRSSLPTSVPPLCQRRVPARWRERLRPATNAGTFDPRDDAALLRTGRSRCRGAAPPVFTGGSFGCLLSGSTESAAIKFFRYATCSSTDPWARIADAGPRRPPGRTRSSAASSVSRRGRASLGR